VRTLTLSLAAALFSTTLFAADPSPANPGVLPTGPDNKPLNLDFEAGTLKDWTASGNAFADQPVKGDVVAKRRTDMKSNHRGEYWVGTFESPDGDKRTGTLTCVPFKVTHPWASFLVGGGPVAGTANSKERVEIVRADTKAVIFVATGLENEAMSPVAVDLREQQGKEIFIRVVDEDTGHWGHINFDDFKFYSAQPAVPPRPTIKPPPPLDTVKFAGLDPQKAAEAMTVAPGFTVQVFAAEPDVVQPVAMTIDDRGRIWVAEAVTYPKRAPEGQGKDRILIFEDTNGDGRFDKRTVFADNLNLVSGIEVGFGGVFVGASPYLMFIPNKDDKAGEPQILLDGFHYEDTHELLNSFTWGPDGWLYGCHGVFTHSVVGKPGTPAEQRVKINAGVWRYHPTKQIFEVFGEGTSNPWGLDFNDNGQCFITACVVPHLFHIVQGGRFTRQAGQHFNPYTYKDITTVADHLHWNNAAKDQWAANNRSDAFGGGHAHAGAMIYLGGLFPEQYRDQIIFGNIHGNRLNNDLLERQGSGFVGHHGKDFLLANDKWSRPISEHYGPDGSVYLIDWYDKQACHLTNPEVWDRSNGRIYRITYNNAKSSPVDLTKMSNAELVKLQTNPNEWYVRHARRILQERKGVDAIPLLTAMLSDAKKPTEHLRALWALNAVGGIDDPLLMSELKNPNEYARAWAIQLAAENHSVSAGLLSQFVSLSANDPSPVVRLYLASAVERLPLDQRWDIVANLVKHNEDATDHNLPLMYWYALEPLAAASPTRALTMVRGTKIPDLVTFTARRIAAATRK
jgi:putative membrane-bound dehydrogenase-like protein